MAKSSGEKLSQGNFPPPPPSSTPMSAPDVLYVGELGVCVRVERVLLQVDLLQAAAAQQGLHLHI